jgi:hypothetical protein
MKLMRSSSPSIRNRDGNGRLVLSGFQWTETAWHETLKLTAFAAAAVIATPIAVSAHGPAGFSLLLFTAFCLASLVYKRNRLRVIAFDREGRVRAPNGLPWFFWRRGLPFSHATITSIEALQDGERNNVAIYTSEGQTFIVSELQRLGDARLVAVQLTKALQEMRHSLATSPGVYPEPIDAGKMIEIH